MAKIVEGDNTWSVKIRCAHPVCALFGGLHRVDGCFSVIEISMDDFNGYSDNEGDWHVTVDCPNCGQTLYPEWQVGGGVINNAIKHIKSKEKKF